MAVDSRLSEPVIGMVRDNAARYEHPLPFPANMGLGDR